MKGEALITIKDKNGKVKQQVKNGNVVFDIPKELLKHLIKGAKFPVAGQANSNPYGSSLLSPFSSSILGFIQGYEDWFKAIKVNDETCDTTDYTDYKVPVLFGSEGDKNVEANTRYAKYDSNNSTKNNNVLKKVYTWNNCPAFTIRSINLCHYNSLTYNPAQAIESANGSMLVKYGKYYISKMYSGGASRPFNRYYNYLYEDNGQFNWSNNRIGFNTSAIRIGGDGGGGAYSILDLIYTAKSREIILLKRENDLNSADSNYSYGPRYVIVIDADTGNIKRSFPITQFSGVVAPSSDYANVYAKVFTTEFGNFLMIDANRGTPYKINIYKIPDQSEMSNYSNNESIPVWYENLNTNLFSNTNGNPLLGCTIIKNVALFTRDGNYTYNKALKINSATLGDVTLYDYLPTNRSNIGTSYNDYAGKHATTYLDEYLFREGIPTWFNTTALNLSEGVAVAEGDTVTIEYTITAN